MPRPKRLSDELYNERRRAKRLAERLKREQITDAEEKTATARYLADIEREIQRSYVNKNKITVEEALERSKTLSAITKRDVRKAENRKRVIYEHEISSARRGELGTIFGDKDPAGVSKMFMAATRRYWEGKPNAERYDAIVNGLGVSDLREAFRAFERANSNLINRYLNELDEDFDEEEEGGYDEEYLKDYDQMGFYRGFTDDYGEDAAGGTPVVKMI